MPRYTVYDLETTGLEKAFDVPLQFAAISTNEEFKEVQRYNWRGRPPRHVLPGPKALLLTGQRISDVLNQPLSHYDFLGKIFELFERQAPTIVTAFNGIGYDEEILRHSFYGTLRNPYVTQFNGNERLDMMRATKAVAVAVPGALEFPINSKNKRSFKLELIAPANGFQSHHAHDALGDVEATIFLAQKMQEKAPKVWDACSDWQSKAKMGELFQSQEPIVVLDWNHKSDKPTTKLLLPICQDETNPNEWICVNLIADPKKLTSLSSDTLQTCFKSGKGPTPLVCVKTNNMPLALPATHALVGELDLVFDVDDVENLLSDPTFADRLKAANDLKKSKYSEPSHVRQALYSGGFFPTLEDRDKFLAFHGAGPNERVEIAKDFSDPRAKELARWLIGSEWPAALPIADRKAFEEELRDHLMAEDAEWMTIPRALIEIDKLMQDASGDEVGLLEEYRVHLTGLAGTGAMAAE